MTEEEYLEKIKAAVIGGDQEETVSLTRSALQEGINALSILNKALTVGADEVGEKFETGEYFLSELMLTGRALKSAMDVLEEDLQAEFARNPELRQVSGTVVIGTVHHDIHDIGKNIVSSMLTAAGFEVHDLGVDVPNKTLLAKAREVEADIIACSALLTTSIPLMRDLVRMLKDSGYRERFQVIVGGAPVTEDFAHEIGADGTAGNAVAAVRLAQKIIQNR